MEMNKKLNGWQIMEEMVKQKKDIRTFRHILGVELKGKKNNKYSELKIQIDEETHHDIADMIMKRGKEKLIICYVMDKSDFEEIQNQ